MLKFSSFINVSGSEVAHFWYSEQISLIISSAIKNSSITILIRYSLRIGTKETHEIFTLRVGFIGIVQSSRIFLTPFFNISFSIQI